jgi:hypothetical protein
MPIFDDTTKFALFGAKLEVYSATALDISLLNDFRGEILYVDSSEHDTYGKAVVETQKRKSVLGTQVSDNYYNSAGSLSGFYRFIYSTSGFQWSLDGTTGHYTLQELAFFPTVDGTRSLGLINRRFLNTYTSQLRPGMAAVPPLWTSGTGSPEGVLAAVVGSLYTRTDGGALTTLYVKESGTGNTGWVFK